MGRPQRKEHGFAAARALAEDDGVPAQRIVEVVGELADRGLLTGQGDARQLTADGREHADRLLGARRDLLAETLADDDATRDPEVSARLARELCGEPPVLSAADSRV